jgi:catechol 2,3-dioxygenase-like lactoylglutathione lyase family enzyme
MRKTLVIGMMVAVSVMAQEKKLTSESVPAFQTRGAFFALSVADLKASTDWYREKFGMKVTMQTPKQDGNQAVVLEGGGVMVELIRRDAAQPLAKLTSGMKDNTLVYGFFKAGVVVDDLEETLKGLRARGVEIAMGPFPAKDNVPANVIVRDNAGNLIQFFEKK